jgi:sortase A
MRKKIGIICILLGFICILGAVCCIVYNRWESENAANVTESLLAGLQSVIDDSNKEQDDVQTEMPTVKVDGYECIGILSIPVLELELPILTDWSYVKLKKAPCHYYGSYYEENFVIAAHNYKAHFGRLSELQIGDVVTFTDVNGVVYHYEVELLETLSKDATKEMIASGFALSLYTCTPGGGNRVTVRCKSMQENN